MADEEQTPIQEEWSTPSDGPSPAVVWLGRFLRLALVVAILAAAVGVAWYWLTNRPQAQRRKPQRQAVLVEVQRVAPRRHQVTVRAMGVVIPSRSTPLSARVGGQVVAVAPPFVPGGRFAEGEQMLRIDPNDFLLAVRQQQAELARREAELTQREADIRQRRTDVTNAEAQIAIEMGQQAVARREYELLGDLAADEDRELVLREPQLRMARARKEAAEAAVKAAEGAKASAEAMKDTAEVLLAKARLDLSRTSVTAPCNAVVLSRNVNLGSQVSAGATLAVVADTDVFWVRVSIPLDELRRIRVPGVNAEAGTGSPVKLFHQAAWGEGAFREGRVVRLMTELEPRGRMAQVLVEVQDPLDLTRPPAERRPLLLDSYVRAEIAGEELAGVIPVPRTALRDGNKVWVMDDDGALDIRPVRIEWSGPETVYVRDGMAPGARLVVSDLGAPVRGMALRTAESAASSPSGGKGEPEGGR